jgi:hypothetical protein
MQRRTIEYGCPHPDAGRTPECGALRRLSTTKATNWVAFRLRFCVFLQDRFVVLAAIKHAKNGHQVDVHDESDDHALALVGHPQPRTYIFALVPASWERRKAFEELDDGLGESIGDVRGRCGSGVAVQLRELILGLWREDYAVRHRDLRRSVARRALTASGVTAREGSALSASSAGPT